MRDFNACVARAVDRLTPEYEGGQFWARRYSSEFLPDNDDIEAYFFYTVLQPVQDGLVEKISDYPGYNCFNDAIYGIKRQFKVVRWAKYNAAKRHNPDAQVRNYTEIVTLEYARLPGYEDLTRKEYADLMLKKLEERRQEVIQKRRASGLGFVGREKLLRTPPGALPRHTKTSTQESHRPRILAVCAKRRAEHNAWYYETHFEYKEASARYRAGELSVQFPEGTYRPYCSTAPPLACSP